MRNSAKTGLLAAIAVLGAALSVAPAHAEGPEVAVFPDGSRLSNPEAPTTFTGDVQSKPLFDLADYSDMSFGQVSFQPGARTAWHSQPAGQTLIVTVGTGWVQQWGGPKQQMTVVTW